MQENKKLPIGIQTFKKIAQDNYCYVDKTHFVQQLLNEGTYYFLSRPRRFGKSLFLSTLKAAFEGRRELFQGLFLYKLGLAPEQSRGAYQFRGRGSQKCRGAPGDL